MAIIPHFDTHRLTFSRGRWQPSSGWRLPAARRAEPHAPTQSTMVPTLSEDDGMPSPAASLAPVLVSLGGLFVLAIGAAYTGREVIDAVASLLAAG